MTSTSDAEQDLLADAVRALTRAAQYAQTHRETFDFPRMVGESLAATSAAVGGAEHLIGKDGESWEAHHVAALSWTYYPEPARAHGPSPVIIPVNVAEIVENDELHPGLLSLDAAIDRIGDRYATIKDSHDLDAWDDEIHTVESRYHREYLTYVDRFAAAAGAASRKLGLDAGVYIAADTNPSRCWWNDDALLNPREGVDRSDVCALWNYAHDTVTLPNVDLDYGGAASHHLARGA